MSKPISIRLPEDLAKRLEGLATSTDRPKTYLIRKAIEAYIAEYADQQIALDRLRDKNDPTISGADLRKSLGR